MNNRVKRNRIKKYRRIIILLVLILSVIFFYNIINNKSNVEPIISYSAFEKIELDRFRILEYYIYGSHLSLKGKLPLNDVNNIENVTLILVNKLKDESIEIETDYEISDSIISFNTKGLINDSLYLDNLTIGDYYLFLKVDSNSIKYYSGLNETDYNSLTYYTLTNNNKNNKIDISFGYKNEVPFMEFNIKDTKLPDEIYDIVIDPGHGGKDPGNTIQSIPEKEQVLEISKKIKTKLEDLGYKVLLTRESDINPGNITFEKSDGTINYIDSYGEGGRIAMSYESKAKYTFSIHTNAHPKASEYYGLEIYTPSEIDYDLADSLAINIKDLSGVNYSTNWYYRKDNGIYTRYLSNDDLASMEIDADDLGYQMYPASKTTLFNYMIRETGGYMMGAYVDGRDPEKGSNPYRDYNYGTETYLIEFGYASSEIDYPKIVNNKDGMAEGLTVGFINYINSK